MKIRHPMRLQQPVCLLGKVGHGNNRLCYCVLIPHHLCLFYLHIHKHYYSVAKTHSMPKVASHVSQKEPLMIGFFCGK